MVFDDITGEGRLWAVKYDGENVNAFEQTFGQWCDLEWLTAFFVTNKEDLERYFHIRSIDRAIYDTMGDAIRLESIILDLTADSDLDTLFRPLNNLQCSEFLLGKEKAKGRRQKGSSSSIMVADICPEIAKRCISDNRGSCQIDTYHARAEPYT